MCNYHTFASDHSMFLLLLLLLSLEFFCSPKPTLLFPSTYLSPFFSSHTSLNYFCKRQSLICLRPMCEFTAPLFLSVFSILTLSPNTTLLFPLDEIFSSDHGPFLLSFPLPDSFHSLFCHLHLLCFTLPLTTPSHHKLSQIRLNNYFSSAYGYLIYHDINHLYPVISW